MNTYEKEQEMRDEIRERGELHWKEVSPYRRSVHTMMIDAVILLGLLTTIGAFLYLAYSVFTY